MIEMIAIFSLLAPEPNIDLLQTNIVRNSDVNKLSGVFYNSP